MSRNHSNAVEICAVGTKSAGMTKTVENYVNKEIDALFDKLKIDRAIAEGNETFFDFVDDSDNIFVISTAKFDGVKYTTAAQMLFTKD